MGADRDLSQPRLLDRVPLVRSWWLSKKKGKEAFVVPTRRRRSTHPSGLRVEFESVTNEQAWPDGDGRWDDVALCVSCGTAVLADLHPLEQGRASTAAAQLMATVAEGERKRIYLDADAMTMWRRSVAESAQATRDQTDPASSD